MKKKGQLWGTMSLVLSLLICGSCMSGTDTRSSSPPPSVILKLDDLWHKNEQVHPGWEQVMTFLNEAGISASIGVIGESLQEGDEVYFQWIKTQVAEGHELWNHGYCHCKPVVEGLEVREFRGMSLAYQLDHLRKTQQLPREKLDLTLTTFGAPYNSTDSSTVAAIHQVPELSIWLYKETAFPTDKTVLARIPAVNIEYPVHVPDFEQFKAGYAQHTTAPVLVIQGHPRSWTADSTRWQNFQSIIHFLQAEQVEFTTPSAYLSPH